MTPKMAGAEWNPFLPAYRPIAHSAKQIGMPKKISAQK